MDCLPENSDSNFSRFSKCSEMRRVDVGVASSSRGYLWKEEAMAGQQNVPLTPEIRVDLKKRKNPNHHFIVCRPRSWGTLATSSASISRSCFFALYKKKLRPCLTQRTNPPTHPLSALSPSHGYLSPSPRLCPSAGGFPLQMVHNAVAHLVFDRL